MSQQMVLANGEVLQLAVANGERKWYEEAFRDVIEFQMVEGSITLEELDLITSNINNLISFSLSAADEWFLYERYVLRIAVDTKVVSITDMETGGIIGQETRHYVVLAQATEQELENLMNPQAKEDYIA
ncbi:MAG: hypothetical protein E7L17_10950 [Clostridium sp.]|uniref:hypothetical protein n=1 Tax=Clostridium sp. TaxID=1506 RepID=UPI002906FCF5|nr:hypothetical protein [Clostridium sp.]MDU7338618.1 hypothetical protein [Clostridium sp.]